MESKHNQFPPRTRERRFSLSLDLVEIFKPLISGLAALTDPEHDSIIICQLRDARWMNKEVVGVDKNPATNLL